MYLDSNATTFCTLALGEIYNKRVHTLIQSVIKFTHNKIVVITDDVKQFGTYYGDRVILIDFDTCNSNKYPKIINGIFNYNLKILPIQYVVNNLRSEYTVYMDADSFLFGWDTSFIYSFKSSEYGMFARYRQSMISDNQLSGVKTKLTQLNYFDIDYPLVIENILVLRLCDEVYNFINKWNDVINESISLKCTPFMESVELGIAAYLTKLPIHTLNYRTCSENFRTLHNGDIHTPIIF